jgi:hypothetical protein
MNSTFASLIAKDLFMNRWGIVSVLLGGVVSLALCLTGTLVGIAVGGLGLLVGVVVLGCMLSMGIWGERKEGALLFTLSLPVSARGYLTARMLGALLSFLIPWSLLAAGAVLMIELSRLIPHGQIPFTVLLFGFLLLEFCLLTSVALRARSEAPLTAAMIVTNSSVSLFWWGIISVPAVGRTINGPAAVWNTTVLSILAVEIVLSALLLVLPIQLSSRRSPL